MIIPGKIHAYKQKNYFIIFLNKFPEKSQSLSANYYITVFLMGREGRGGVLLEQIGLKREIMRATASCKKYHMLPRRNSPFVASKSPINELLYDICIIFYWQQTLPTTIAS